MKAVYVCDPGAPRDGRYTDEQLAEPCKCRHARYDHWWGEGACGECGPCDYFRPRTATS